MSEIHKTEKLKESIRSALVIIQAMLPGDTGDFLISKRDRYFPKDVDRTSLAAFFNEGQVVATGLDEEKVNFKLVEACMAILLDRAFADVESVLPVIAKNVRNELSTLLQHELGIKIQLDFLTPAMLRFKMIKELEKRGPASAEMWKRATTPAQQSGAPIKGNGNGKVVVHGAKNVHATGCAQANSTMVISAAAGGGAEAQLDARMVIAKLDELGGMMSHMKRKLDNMISPQQLHTAVSESEGRMQAELEKRLKLERGRNEKRVQVEHEWTEKRVNKIEAVLREFGVMPELVDLTIDDDSVKEEKLLDKDDEQEGETEEADEEEAEEEEDENAAAAALGF